MKNRNWLWGIFFIVAAVLVVLNKMDIYLGINVWSLLLTILLVPIIISAVVKRNFFNLFFSIAFLLIAFAKPLNITALVPWTVLIAAGLLSVGFSILMPSKYRWMEGIGHHHNDQWKKHDSNYEKYETVDHVDGNEISCYVSLGGSCKYLHSSSLERGKLDCSMGYLKVYFDNVQLHPDGAVIEVNCSLGSTELYIPRHWCVKLDVDCVLGNVEEYERPQNFDGPALMIKGSVRLGNLVIRYI